MPKVIARTFFIVFMVFLGVYLLVDDNQAREQIKLAESIKSVQVGDVVVRVKLAVSREEQTKGLGGVTLLNDNEGMLFVFDKPDYNYLWMKDMQIPIDMIWFDEFEKVIHFEENVKPETYPEVFGPDLESKYILETASGFVEKNGIQLGDRIFFLP